MKQIFSYLIVVLLAQIYGCSGCSKSGRIKSNTRSVNLVREEKVPEKVNNIGRKTTVSMKREDGVYQIPVKINGTEMYFIFDTGAGMISISAVEATFLYRQGKLNDNDVVGKANFVDANGDITEGVVIKLRTVTIGDRTLYNVEASVVDNTKAPLLFGQSALEKFGKISIDYEKSQITFE